MQGYLGIRSGFIRTPKFNVLTRGEMDLQSEYAKTNFSWLTLTEGLLIFYFLFGIVQAFYFKNYGTLPLLMMAFTGFMLVFVLTLRENRQKNMVAVHD